MSQSVVNCNSNNHHHQQQRQQQQQSQHQNSRNVYNIVVAPACSGLTNYPATLDDDLPPIGVSDSTSITNTTDATVAFDRSRQTRVIVAPNISSSSPSLSLSSVSSSAVSVSASADVPQQQPHSSTEEPSSNPALYGTTTSSSPYLTAQAGYLSSHSPSVLHSSCSSSNFVYSSNFFQPYYGLSPTLNEFNVLQMCCQPLFTEIASQGTDIAPTAESLYGFANRLHPITPTVFLIESELKPKS
ncbi:unnamed protein product [Cercopithifilaria johnstoni]|uniref:Uncharacterized protein n=1 Tax=Cercopithifilaria johnstoni TaxID=2874296 RepID=A0A8J2MT85_9BILA|nr:unnamed protein product [Cercopithifilaria johnstoni]